MTEQSRSDAAEHEAAEDASHRVLSFRVAGATYAIPIGVIKEILEYGAVTRVPMTPRHIRGVLNLRGTVLPVVDLAARLDKRAAAPGRRSCVLVLALQDGGGETVDVGVLVDGVSEVLALPESAIEPAPAFGTSIAPELIEGIGKVGSAFVVLLAVGAVFDIETLAVPGAAA